MKETIIFTVFLIVAIILGILSWKFERWVSWKFNYGNKINVKIEQLEQRIENLENER